MLAKRIATVRLREGHELSNQKDGKDINKNTPSSKKESTSPKTVSERSRKKKKDENSFFRMFLRALWTIMKIVIPAVFLLGVVLVIFIFASADKLDVEDLRLDISSHVCYIDEDGEIKEYEQISTVENRSWVPLNQVPQDMRDAFVAIEDERFYSHSGFDIKRTTRAVLEYLHKGSGAQGGSTITQQLIKNLTENDDRTPVRKMQEIWMAYQLERKLSKDQILELYMNTIYLAQGVNGVQTAAQLYFDKDVGELTLAQCASIAGITQYPAYYDPFINPENNKEKQLVVLKKMVELEYITEEEYNEAISEELVFRKGNMQVTSARTQSYFTDQVVQDVIYALVTQKGYSKTLAERKLQSGGYKIISTLDPMVQENIDKVFSSESNFPWSPVKPVPQGAIVVMNAHTGEVLGMAGGIGKKEGSFSLNRATGTYRQPGSSIKPIAVYGPALDRGIIKPNTIYTDKKVTYGSWSPKNFYSGYRGDMTVRNAVRDSVNTVAVQVVADLGREVSYDYLKNRFKLSSVSEHDTAWGALALGGLTTGASVIDMTAAYAAFPAEGVYHKPITFTKVIDGDGKVVITNKSETHQAVKKETAAMMNELLKNVVTSGTATGASISGIQVAGKTGTTDDNKDRWFVGYTADYVAGVWYGFDEPRSMGYLGSNPAITAWKRVMEPFLKAKKGESDRDKSDFWTYRYDGYYYNPPAPEEEENEEETEALPEGENPVEPVLPESQTPPVAPEQQQPQAPVVPENTVPEPPVDEEF